jgi:hypothetical protein
MKKLLFALLFVTFFSNVHAQSVITKKDWSRLVDLIVVQDWLPANKLSLSLLNSIPFVQVNSREAPKLRYMYMLSEAGLLNTGKVTETEALNSVIGFIGKPILFPWHPVSEKRELNSFSADVNTPDTLVLMEGNQEDNAVFTLYYVVLKNKWTAANIQANAGKTLRFDGIFKSISVKNKRLEIVIEDATAEERQP